MRRLLCVVIGHGWRTETGFRLRDVDWYVGSGYLTCDRCGRRR